MDTNNDTENVKQSLEQRLAALEAKIALNATPAASTSLFSSMPTIPNFFPTTPTPTPPATTPTGGRRNKRSKKKRSRSKRSRRR